MDRKFSYNDLLEFTSNFSEQNRLGKGGFAEVYKGFIPQDNKYGLPEQTVAIKRAINKENPRDKALQDGQFETEREWLAKLNDHPNIINLIGYTNSPDQPKCLVLEYAARGTLTGCIKDLQWDNIKDILIKIGKTIWYIHVLGGGYIHGDLKTDNVLMTETMEPKLCDFGTFRLEDKVDINEDASKDSMVYTTGYIDPERLHRKGFTTKQGDDVYAFGVMILQLIMKADRPIKEVSRLGPRTGAYETNNIAAIARGLFTKGKSIVHSSFLKPCCKENEVRNLSELAIDITYTQDDDEAEASKGAMTIDVKDMIDRDEMPTDEFFNMIKKEEHVPGYYIMRPEISIVFKVLENLNTSQPYQRLSKVVRV